MARRAKARELLDRSRVLLDRSRVVAAQLLDPPRQSPTSEPRALGPAPADPPTRSVESEQGPSEEALVDICASVALRDLNLVDTLLSQLEEMETKEEDAQRLGQLYRLDHLATRLRRNAENLRVLSGRDASDNSSDTSSLVDAIRAAMSSIDQYSRITIGRVAPLGVVGFAADDLSRLLAELLDNAANQSPPNSEVRVSAHLTEQGSVLVRIEDEGIGLPPERLDELNERLSGAPVLDNAAVRHMGLAVVRRLAGRHEMRVSLDRRVPHGTTATVLLPASLVSELSGASWSGTQTVSAPQLRHAAPDASTTGEIPVQSANGVPTAGGFAPTTTSVSGELPRRRPGSAGTATAPSTPSPSPSSGSSSGSLPKRRPTPIPSVGGTTASGLPRRVSRSLKNPTNVDADDDPFDNPEDPIESPAPADSGSKDADLTAGHDQLLADLSAFSDGEQAAKDAQQRGSGGSGTGDESAPADQSDQSDEGPQ